MNAVPACALSLTMLLSPIAFAGEARTAGAQPPVAAAQTIPRPGPNASFHTNLAWQIALDGARFSPGILDGKWGRKGEMALRDYAQAHGAQTTDLGVDVDHPTAPYTVGAADLAEVGPYPEDWNERAKLDRMRYPGLHEGLAEKFHCTQALLARLNPGVRINDLKAGDTLTAPRIRPFPTPGLPRAGQGQVADHLRIDLSAKAIRAFDAHGRQLALFHCSVAKNKEHLPDRDAVVRNVAVHPNYTFDPKGWPEIHDVDRVLTIAPGPRNPVGIAWIGLDLPGYGIHGNPKPELIGKTGSHGCFRLTNWDALALVSMVKTGMKVEIVASGR